MATIFRQFKAFQPKTKQRKTSADDLIVENEDDLKISVDEKATSKFDSGLTQTKTLPYFPKQTLAPANKNKIENKIENKTEKSFSSKDSLSEKSSNDIIEEASGFPDEHSPQPRDFKSVPIIRKELQIIEAEPVITRIAEPIRNRLTVNLPIDELNVAKVQAKVSLETMEKNIENISRVTEATTRKLKDAAQNMRDVQLNAMNLAQTADIISGKLNVLDDWMDGLEGAGDTVKIQAIEVGVKFISILSSLILVIWHSILAANPFKLCRRKKNKTKKIEAEDTTDEATDNN